MHSMKYEGIWQHILSAAAQHAGTRQPSPNVMPRATFLLSITPVWISLSWFIMKPSSLSASAKKVGVNIRVSLRCFSARGLTACTKNTQYTVAGWPWALVFLSWSWAAHGGEASFPGSTSQVYPAMAAPRSLPRHWLNERRENQTPQFDQTATCYMTTKPRVIQCQASSAQPHHSTHQKAIRKQKSKGRVNYVD